MSQWKKYIGESVDLNTTLNFTFDVKGRIALFNNNNEIIP